MLTLLWLCVFLGKRLLKELLIGCVCTFMLTLLTSYHIQDEKEIQGIYNSCVIPVVIQKKIDCITECANICSDADPMDKDCPSVCRSFCTVEPFFRARLVGCIGEVRVLSSNLGIHLDSSGWLVIYLLFQVHLQGEMRFCSVRWMDV